MNTIRIEKIVSALSPILLTIVGLAVGYSASFSSQILELLIKTQNQYEGLVELIELSALGLLILVIVNLLYQFFAHERSRLSWLLLSLVLGFTLGLAYFSIDTLNEIINYSIAL